MADFNKSFDKIMTFEGGYVPPPGETFKGIDRDHNSGWGGWALIDAYKKQYGTPKRGFMFSGYTQLNDLVKDWYINVYFKNKIDFAAIENQTAADLILDFVVHKNYDAIRVINIAAKVISPSVETATTKLSEGVIKVINSTTSAVYKLIRSYRILYYLDPSKFGSKYKFSKTIVEKNFIPRTTSFPEAA